MGYSLSTDDESEMDRLIPGVKRLQNDRINVYRQRPPAVHKTNPRPTPPDPPSVSTAASRPVDNSHFNSGLQIKLQRKIRQGAIRLESSVDLHGYRQAEALETLQDLANKKKLTERDR